MQIFILIVSGIAVVTTGLLAGVMLGVAMEQQTAQRLEGSCWIVRQNLNDNLFRMAMPPTFLLTLLSAAAASILLHSNARVWMVAALVAAAIAVGVTLILEVPLNNRMAEWSSATLPEDWRTFRDQWLRNHWLRTLFGLGSFLCCLVAAWAAHF